MKADVVVIGGGASGMMAAITAAGMGKRVLLIEKNHRLGRKLLITGKGRCNITNRCDMNTFINHVPTNGKFLYSAFSQFSSEDTIQFFESLGLSLKVERGNRVFPVSDQAVDVVDAMASYIKRMHVTVVEDCVCDLLIQDGKLEGVVCEKDTYYANAVIVATGGASYPKTGSDGIGYLLAKNAGHTVRKPSASLIPIVTSDAYCKNMQGLSLKNVELKVLDKNDGNIVFKQMGELLFTHFGVSGPLVLSASAHMRKPDKTMYSMWIDLKPALSYEQLDARLLRDFEKYANKNFIHSLKDLLPQKMIGVIASISKIPFMLKVHQITKEQRSGLIKLMKEFPLHPVGFRPVEEAIITSGGVSIAEIHPKSMESKIMHDLYFCGEVMDVDAYTGGFNLQIAFSTGYVAGMNA